MNNINEQWLDMLKRIKTHGGVYDPRGMPTEELLGDRMCIDMRQPALTVKDRKLNYSFMAAEAYWICTGDNRVETIAPYNKRFETFSDNGVTFFGAYGPPVRIQMDGVIRELSKDEHSRRAVICTWKNNPPVTKDIPCNMTTQFLIRDHKLHVIQNIRSSDAWLGVPYDIFSFSMVATMICLELREFYPELELGMMCFFAGSRHLYHEHSDKVENLLKKEKPEVHQYLDMNISEFNSQSLFLEHLLLLRDKRFKELKYNFLAEMRDWV